MRRVNTGELTPGLVTAEDIYTVDGQLIIPKGLILDEKTIGKLKHYLVINILVEDEAVDLNAYSVEINFSHAQKVKNSPEFTKFKEKFESDVDNFKSMINDVVKKGSPLKVDELVKHTLNTLEVSSTTGDMLDMLHNMRDYDDATFAHSMNVALICNVMARWLRMNEQEITDVTVSGLLHDIGKTQIPDEIIKKPGKLTEEEYKLVKKHPQFGYEMLKPSKLDSGILTAVLMHHERCDGSGYPLKLHAPQISTYARIVSIADVYDAMTSARVYRGPLCPFRSIELFEDEGFQKYDPHYIMNFLENVVNTYLLNDVELTDGRKGTIVYINKDRLSSPTVKSDADFVDLSKAPDLRIEKLI